MPFMVIYSTSDGTSCHEQADAIDEAALLVERLRNKEGIQEIRIYRMEEISFAFRPYYKVELGMPDRLVTSSPPAEVFGSAPVAPAADEPSTKLQQPGVTAAPGDAPSSAPPVEEDDESGANGRRGLFGR